MKVEADDGYRAHFIKRYSGDVNGMGLAIQSGGKLAIGSGESAINFMNGDGNYAAENSFLTADQSAFIITNMQEGFANRRTFHFRGDGLITTPSGNVVTCNSADGVTELARYIDMRDSNSNGNSPDYHVRLRCFDNGELHVSGKLTIGSMRQEVAKIHYLHEYPGIESQSNGAES
ncbi:hypothetical protein [Paraclostridium dentum]|uniref:hypothetical protein n=1 Tax=Paraclostridium dentum TaxID=2662455 RepID=UPI003F38936B